MAVAQENQARRRLTAAEVLDVLLRPARPGEAGDLRNVDVEGPLVLDRKTASGFDFTGSVFHGPVSAVGGSFDALTWFRDCTFQAGADFSKAVFCHDARFDGSVFVRGATFSFAELRGVLDLDGSRFCAPAYLDHLEVLGSLSLANTKFEDVVSLEATQCMGGLWCANTHFAARPDVRAMEVHGRTWLRGVTLERERGAGLGRGPEVMKQQMTTYGYAWL